MTSVTNVVFRITALAVLTAILSVTAMAGGGMVPDPNGPSSINTHLLR